MKKMIVIPTVCMTFGFLLFARAGAPPSGADRFVSRFAESLRLSKTPVTTQEQDILRKAYPLLLRAADDKVLPVFFWEMVRQAPPETIEWSKAKQLIQSGKVVSVSQTHRLDVALITRDGRNYHTKAPEIDLVNAVLREVDPNGVFMLYETE